MSKPKKKPPEAVCVVSWRDKNGKIHRNSGPSPFGEDGGGCGFCLLNTMLLAAAPTAVVALLVKRVRR